MSSVAIGFCAPLCVARKWVGVGELVGVPGPAAGAGGGRLGASVAGWTGKEGRRGMGFC